MRPNDRAQTRFTALLHHVDSQRPGRAQRPLGIRAIEDVQSVVAEVLKAICNGRPPRLLLQFPPRTQCPSGLRIVREAITTDAVNGMLDADQGAGVSPLAANAFGWSSTTIC